MDGESFTVTVHLAKGLEWVKSYSHNHLIYKDGVVDASQQQSIDTRVEWGELHNKYSLTQGWSEESFKISIH